MHFPSRCFVSELTQDLEIIGGIQLETMNSPQVHVDVELHLGFPHYNKMCPYMPNDFIGFWVNSLVPMNKINWGCNEFIGLVNIDYWIASTFCSNALKSRWGFHTIHNPKNYYWSLSYQCFLDSFCHFLDHAVPKNPCVTSIQ
jgi:hypothetical protein